MPKRDEPIPGTPQDVPPPEIVNDEQDPTGEQAQDVAEDARREDSRTASPLESAKPASGGFDPAPDSTGDLVDEMRRMEGEGRIDMSAFAGEPNHDDEPEAYGGETTDDDEAEWLTADGEALNEEEIAESLDEDGFEDLARFLEDADGEEEEE